ncbi:MAG: ferredoxin [Catenulisporales bacterium]|jgi:ferredoxin|nr:ferredoxin [Catenulisporales bacterium]
MTSPTDTDTDTDGLEVWIDHDLCTGDGICAQYAPDVFELDIDGIAYVKASADGELLSGAEARVPVPVDLMLAVIDSAGECPGECIHVRRAADHTVIAGPGAQV